MPKQPKRAKTGKKLTITVELQGAQVDTFLRWKTNQFISANAEAARKLILERLQDAAPAQAANQVPA